MWIGLLICIVPIFSDIANANTSSVWTSPKSHQNCPRYILAYYYVWLLHQQQICPLCVEFNTWASGFLWVFFHHKIFVSLLILMWPTNICCNLIFSPLTGRGLEPLTSWTSLLHATKSPIGLAHLEIPSRHEALLSLLFYCYRLVTCPVTREWHLTKWVQGDKIQRTYSMLFIFHI